MKYIPYLLTLLLFCASCEEVIDVDLPTAEPQLVVEADLRQAHPSSPGFSFSKQIKLTLTAPFFSEERPPATGATVSLIDEDNITYAFQEGTPGSYQAVDVFDLEINKNYTLNITYEGENYTATSKMMPAVPIDGLEQDMVDFFGQERTEIKITFTDDGTRDDFYLFDLDENYYIPGEDKFYNGNQFTFSAFGEDIESGDVRAIQILGIDQQFFNYMRIILDQSGAQGGGPFQSPPVAVRGNILNTTNPDNFPLGYFFVSEAAVQQITFE